MANPTASERGTKSDFVTPVIRKDGTNTATMQSIDRKRGTTVLLVASSTARALDSAWGRLLLMFSISTVASSTKMPTASANPPSVMILMV